MPPVFSIEKQNQKIIETRATQSLLEETEKTRNLLEKTFQLTPLEKQSEFQEEALEPINKAVDSLEKPLNLLKKSDKPVLSKQQSEFQEELLLEPTEPLKEFLKDKDKNIQDSEIFNLIISKTSNLVSEIEGSGKLVNPRSDIKQEWIELRKTFNKIRRRLTLLKPSTDEEELRQELRWFATNGDEEDLALIEHIKQKTSYSSEDTLKLFDIALEDISKRVRLSFQLLGYSHPFCEYPAPVVPIGYYDNKLVAYYLGSADPFLVLDEEEEYIKCDDQLKEPLKDFNYLEHKLFAVSENEIVFYPISEEKEFLIELLQDKKISRENPFLIYSLAEITEDIDTIQAELIQCIKYLQDKSPGMISSWYETEKEKLSSIWEQNNLSFPSEEEILKNLAMGNSEIFYKCS